MEYSEHLYMRGNERWNLQYARDELSEGDTLVFVDFPEPRTNEALPEDCDKAPFRSQWCRVHSKKLLDTGSSLFKKMLTDEKKRSSIVRRRELTNEQLEGVKYVLDLTPPEEGDELVTQLTELSLSPGVIKWWSSYARFEVPCFAVQGHDDVYPCEYAQTARKRGLIYAQGHGEMPHYEESLVPKFPLSVSELVRARKDGKKLQVEEVPARFEIRDYCRIRHCHSIIRLLMLIEGQTVFINSAARLWTLVTLAKIWGCGSAVQASALQWFLQENNSKFIEVLPEEALQIGRIIKIPHIECNAFRVLVIELALEQASTDDMEKKKNKVTLFGRRKGNLGDEFTSEIQNAARAFVERMNRRLAELQDPDFFKAWGIAQYNKLLALEKALTSENSDCCRDTLKHVSILKAKLRSALIQAIERLKHRFDFPPLDQNQIDRIERARAAYVEPPDFQEFSEIYKTMTPVQKLMTPYVHTQLKCAWKKWTVDTDGVARPLGDELCKIYKFFEDPLPQDSDSRADLLGTLVENWLDPVVWGQLQKPQCPQSHTLSVSTLNVQVEEKLDELGGKMPDSDVFLKSMSCEHLLLSLRTEMAFLPMSAGGTNDESGGVFEKHLPPSYMGPKGPGPDYHVARDGNTRQEEENAVPRSLDEPPWVTDCDLDAAIGSDDDDDLYFLARLCI